MISRRKLLACGATSGMAIAVGALSRPVFAQAKPKVVVVGGGAGGASVIRQLAAQAQGRLDIILIEPQRTYTACFYSNLYLGGFQSLDVLQYDYRAIAGLEGVSVIHSGATGIERDAKRIIISSGDSFDYDRLVLSPGIALDYESVPGWSKAAEERMPHAWIAGSQTALLKQQIDAIPDGGLVVMIAPPNPYRCPPGPYERVSMIAHALKSAGKTRARIVILDTKTSFSKQPLFQQGWEKYYPNMIEWLPPMIHGGVKEVDPSTMSVSTGFETYTNATLVNVIPRQTAGTIAVESGLASENRFCPVDPLNMKSSEDASIYVLGDASNAGDMPKSAFAANSQAAIVAQSIISELLDKREISTAYQNRCWSLIAGDDSVVVGGSYSPQNGKIAQTENDISQLDDTAEQRRTNYEDSATWFANLTSELFS